jgi:hypothetical protein
MDTEVVVAIVVVLALAALAVAYWAMSQRRRSSRLEERFGPEYERAVSSGDSKREAERQLEDRQRRVERLRIKDLDPGRRREYQGRWRLVQERFVDDPKSAVNEVDTLIRDVMDERGYPVNDFEQQAADLSVNHPKVVSNYRAAHSIAEAHEREGVSTEDLRQAMIHYRELFAELVEGVPARA